MRVTRALTAGPDLVGHSADSGPAAGPAPASLLTGGKRKITAGELTLAKSSARPLDFFFFLFCILKLLQETNQSSALISGIKKKTHKQTRKHILKLFKKRVME